MPSHAPLAPDRRPQRGARWILLGALLLTALSAPFAVRLDRTTDLLAVLPGDDADVQTFLEIGARFDFTHAAIIGLETEDGDLFTVPRLTALRSLARALAKAPEAASVTAFTELMDASVGVGDEEGRTIVQPLVGELPADPMASVAEIRARVLDRPHLVGSLVSRDGAATLVVVVPKHGVDIAPVIRAELERVAQAMPAVELVTHFIGLPFIDQRIAESSAADARRLGPSLFIVLLLTLIATTRCARATLLAVLTGAVPILWTLGVFGALNGALDTVSTIAPLLLLVIGAAVATLTVERARAHGQAADLPWMRRNALRVALPSLALVASPFAAMLGTGVAPLETLALLTIGGCGALLISLVVVLPAAQALLRPQPRPTRQESTPGDGARRHLPGWLLPALAIPVVGATLFMSASPLYLAGGDDRPLRLSLSELLGGRSEAARGEDFLERRFGGALYLQVEVHGDVNHPLMLRQIERLTDEVRPLFADARSVADAFRVAARSLTGEARVPASERTTRALAALLAMEPDLKLLIADDFTRTIMQLRLPLARASEAFALAGQVGDLAAARLGPRVAIAREQLTEAQRTTERDEVAHHLAALTGGKVPVSQLSQALASPAPPPDVKRIAERLRIDIEENELIYLAPDKSIEQLADALVRRDAAARLDPAGPSLAATVEPFSDPKELGDRAAFDDAVRKLGENLQGVARAAATGALVAAVQALAADVPTDRIAGAIAPLNDAYAALPASAAAGQTPSMQATATARVTGHPLVLARQAAVLRAITGRAAVLVTLIAALAGLFFAGGPSNRQPGVKTAPRQRMRAAAVIAIAAGAALGAFILGLQLHGLAFDPALVVGCALAMGVVAASAFDRLRVPEGRAERFALIGAPALLVFYASSLPAAATFGLLTAAALVVGALVIRALATSPSPFERTLT